MRSEWARQVCSTQKAHEIHNAAPAPQKPQAGSKRESEGKWA